VVTRVCVSVCLSVCLSATACLHYCTDPDVTWGNGRGCLLVVHYWADLQSVHGLRCYGNTKNAWQSLPVIRQAHRMPHALRMPANTPLTSDKIDAPAACATLSATTPFHFVHTAGGVVTRTRNVSEYMLVLASCLVLSCVAATCRLLINEYQSITQVISGFFFPTSHLRWY